MLADRLWPVLIIGGATTLLWLAIITSGAGGDLSVYLLPLTMAGGGAVAVMLTKAASRGHTALLLVLITALTVINYRVRGEPENAIERDLQNMIKVAVWGCMLIPALINWRDIVPYFRDPRFGLYLIFIALSLASAAWSIDPLMTVVSASGLLVYLIFGPLLAEVFTTRALVNAMVWSLVGYDVANWLFAAFDPTIGFLAGTMRLQGFSGHPNFLGSQTSVLLCLLIAAYYRGYIGRFWFWILLAFAVITLMATQSRTSGLSVFLAFVACRYRRLFFAVVLFALTCLTLIVITGYLDQLISIFVRPGDGDALAGRIDIWDYVVPKIADRPWFGYGFNIFERFYEFDNPNVLNPMLAHWGAAPIPPHPHNSYLEVLFSGGIITTIPFLAWFGLLLWYWYRYPDLLRDLLVLSSIFGSMTEVGLSGPPSLGTLVCFILLGIDHHTNTIKQRGWTPSYAV